jgi:hypothetical protein
MPAVNKMRQIPWNAELANGQMEGQDTYYAFILYTEW